MADCIPRALAMPAAATAVAAALGLAGCGVPLVITAGSLAGDGISYAASGKSLTDHYISHAMEEDCALHRVFDAEREICIEPAAVVAPEDGEAAADAAAAADPADAAGGMPLSGGTETPRPLVPAAPPAAPGDTPPELLYAPGGDRAASMTGPRAGAAPLDRPVGEGNGDAGRLSELIEVWASGGPSNAAAD